MGGTCADSAVESVVSTGTLLLAEVHTADRPPLSLSLSGVFVLSRRVSTGAGRVGRAERREGGTS